MFQPCQEGILLLLPTTKTAGLEQKREFSDFSEFLLLLWFPIFTHWVIIKIKTLAHTIKVSAFRIKRILSYIASLPAPCARLSRLPASDIIISAKRKYQTLEKCCTPRNSGSLVSQPAFCFYKHWRSCTQLLKPVTGWACDDFPKPHGCSYISIQALEYFQQLSMRVCGITNPDCASCCSFCN